MAIETLTIALTGSNINGSGKNGYITGDKNDNQIVTLIDGGNITGTIQIAKFGKSEIGTETGDPDGGDDTYIIDLSGFDDDFNITVKSMDSGDTFQVFGWLTHTVSGSTHTFTYTGSDGNLHTVTINTYSANTAGGSVDPNATIVCFVEGTLLETETGKQQVEALSKGDMILCADLQFRPIKWVGSTIVNSETLAARPHLQPIKINQHAFALNRPSRDLYVSPQHRILVKGFDLELLFGEQEALVAAKHLVNGTSISIHTDSADVEYFHILFDTHQIVYSEDLETESFFPGDAARTALDQDVQNELLELFPELGQNSAAYGEICKPVLKSFEGRALTNFAR